MMKICNDHRLTKEEMLQIQVKMIDCIPVMKYISDRMEADDPDSCTWMKQIYISDIVNIESKLREIRSIMNGGDASCN